MYQISNNIYQGAQPESWASFVKEGERWAVVSLNHGPPPDPYLPLINLRFPIEDGPNPGMKWLKTVVGCMEQLDQAGYKIYIHCTAGISRSAMVTAAFLMKRHWLPMDTALDVIGKVNDHIHPAKAFRQLLREWERELLNEWGAGT